MDRLHPLSETRHYLPARRRVSDRLMTLIMAGLLFVVGAVTLARTSNTVEVAPAPIGMPVASRVLAFQDLTAGQVSISDSESGQTLRVMAAGEGSFIRGVVRSFARARTQRGLMIDGPLFLDQYRDQRLILSDPSTGQTIELGAFGPTNAGEFAALLPVSEASLSLGQHQ